MNFIDLIKSRRTIRQFQQKSIPEDVLIDCVNAAIENFMLAALSKGVGSCWLASVERDSLRALYQILEDYTIDSVIALGYPAEDPVAEVSGDTIRYWQDADSRLHVLKRPIENILHIISF